MPQLIATLDGVEIHHVHIKRDRTTLGRKPYNHIVLTDSAVSGEHCVFELKGLADVFVQDLGSTNGTYINGHMVQKQLLQDGDVIAIGQVRIEYLSSNENPQESNKTTAMPLESYKQAVATGGRKAFLKVLSGSSAGLEIPVVKAVGTFGTPGVAMVAIAQRRQGYFVSCMEATITPTLNGVRLNDEPRLMADQDVLVLAGTTMQFTLQ